MITRLATRRTASRLACRNTQRAILRTPNQSNATTSRFNSSSSSGSSSSRLEGQTRSVLPAILITAGLTAGLTYFGTQYFQTTAPAASTNTNDPEAGRSIKKIWPDTKYGGLAEFHQSLPELERLLGSDRITMDEEDLKRHGYNEWTPAAVAVTSAIPIAIVYPQSTEEVSEIAKICHRYRLPMIGFSGGSSLEGNFSAPYGGVCIDFAHMNKIVQVRPEDMDATVQPAVGWVELNQQLAKQGTNLFFGVDPGPIAKIGGMVSTSCSGTNCVRYGPMRDHVVNLTVVLADGSIIKTRQRPRKTSAGYNLNHLFCGSEGTLGLITEITVKLQVVPEKTAVAICPFPSVREAADTACDIIRAGIPMHSLELMDEVQMWAANQSGYTARKWAEEPTLFFKFSGTESSVSEQIARAQAIAGEHNGTQFEFAQDEAESAQLWSARKEALWCSLALGPKNGKLYTTDVAVPLSKLADLVMHTKQDIANAGVAYGSALGHVGDGNFHATLIYTDSPEAERAAKQVAQNVVYRGLELGGTCSGEHGVGVSKIDYLVAELGSDTVNLMHTLKLALDPYELLNPGKLFTKEAVEKGIEKELLGTARAYTPFPAQDKN